MRKFLTSACMAGALLLAPGLTVDAAAQGQQGGMWGGPGGQQQQFGWQQHGRAGQQQFGQWGPGHAGQGMVAPLRAANDPRFIHQLQQYSEPMQHLMIAAQRVREATQAMAEMPHHPGMSRAFDEANRALLTIQQAMAQIPVEQQMAGGQRRFGQQDQRQQWGTPQWGTGGDMRGQWGGGQWGGGR